MKLSGTKSEIKDLINQGLLEINSDEPFNAFLKVGTGLNGKPRIIEVEITKEDLGLIKLQESDFLRIKNLFPTLTEFGRLQPGCSEEDRRNLRTGKDDAAKKSIIKLLENHTIDDIIKGINFEINYRVRNLNLKYMKSFAAWLSDSSNAESMITDAKSERIIIKTKDKMI